MSDYLRTYETVQPWVVYHYGRTHDGWWPFWTSTHFLGRARIECECAVCGKREVLNLRIPRFGAVPEPVSGRHPERERFLAEHAHPERGAPMSWKRPLLNTEVYGCQGISFDALAMRLEADLNELHSTTPCCLCGHKWGRPWPEDAAYPMCAECFHVCAHEGQPFRFNGGKP